MHKQVLLSTLALGSMALAQSPCTPPNPSTPTTLTWTTTGTNIYTAYGQSATQVAPFLGSDGYVIDINCTANITLNGFSFQLFNDGDNTPTGVPGLNLGTQPSTTTPPSPPTGPTTCNLNIWECPTTWVGNELLAPPPTGSGPWTLIGTATASYTGPWSSQTVFTVTSPIFLTAGTHGLMFEFVAIPNLPCTQYNNVATPFAPWGPMVKQSLTTPIYSDSYITLQNLGWTANSFNTAANMSVTIGTPPVTGFVDIPMTFTYTPATGAAYSNGYGNGCVFSPLSFAEVWTTPTFDLSYHTIAMFNLGSNYAVSVTAGPPAWFTPTSTSLTAGPYQSSTSTSWDDAISQPITLPWTFPYVGGTTNVIEIGSNGIVLLQHDTDASAAYGYYNGNSVWVAKPANFAVCFGDQDATVNGTITPGNPYGIYYDVDPSGNAVYVTWMTQEWSPAIGPIQTFQLMMDRSGNVEYRYATVNMNAASTAPILVGWTPGNRVSFPDPMNLSATPTFVTGDGSDRTTLALSARPITGTTINAVTSNIHTGTALGLVMLGFGNLANGVSLAPLGAPTCSQYIGSIGANLLFLTPTTAPASVSLTIPQNPALAGLTLAGQSLLLTPGVNALGVLTSNGLCIGIGSF